jgi:dihydrolipoamide dehydrogenase
MYDVLVIGGGPGGYAASIRSAQLGGKVGLVEADLLGGTCVNRGCIPTKVWGTAARAIRTISRMSDFGIKADIKEIELKRIVARKAGVAEDIRTGMRGLLLNNGVDVISGRAVFDDARKIRVGSDLLEARRIIIATGAHTKVPDIPGLSDALLSFSQLFDLTRLPDSVLICGDGYVEVEMAFVLQCFNVEVHLICESSRILPFVDRDSSQRLTQVLRENGIQFVTGSRLKSVEKSGKGFNCHLDGKQPQTINVERVICAPRVPNTEKMELGKAGVNLAEDASVQINECLETSSAGIYAVGDVTGGIMQSHTASAMAITAAENAMGKANRFKFHLIPKTCWTIPEVGSVGLTEGEAEERGHDVEVGEFPYGINGLAMARNELAGSVKIVKDKRYGEILGVHIVGPNATELAGEAALAIQMECTAEDLASGIRAHPTYSEAIVDAARDAEAWALYLPKQ